MNKNLFFFLCLAFLAASCTNDPQAAQTDKPSTPSTTTTRADGEEMKKIKESAISSENLPARAKRGMDKVMVQYKAAAEVIDGFENPNITIDQECNTVFSYEENGHKYEKRFNIGNLGHRNGRMSLEADNGEDILFPGFRIATLSGEPEVEIYKDGKLLQKDNEWYIVLADRKAVETAAPTMVNVINICQEIKKKK